MESFIEALLVAFLALSSCGRINPLNIIFNIALLIVGYLLLAIILLPVKLLLNKYIPAKKNIEKIRYGIFILITLVLVITLIPWFIRVKQPLIPVGIRPFDCLGIRN